jgi:hypothetical protein
MQAGRSCRLRKSSPSLLHIISANDNGSKDRDWGKDEGGQGDAGRGPWNGMAAAVTRGAVGAACGRSSCKSLKDIERQTQLRTIA